jgi:hypothetical protein
MVETKEVVDALQSIANSLHCIVILLIIILSICPGKNK